MNPVLGIKFVYSKDQIDMAFVWIEVRPEVSNLGRDTVGYYHISTYHISTY